MTRRAFGFIGLRTYTLKSCSIVGHVDLFDSIEARLKVCYLDIPIVAYRDWLTINRSGVGIAVQNRNLDSLLNRSI